VTAVGAVINSVRARVTVCNGKYAVQVDNCVLVNVPHEQSTVK
jgi:hypothetical protein